MYCSRNDGDALSTFAMLSNPSLSSSFGNSAATSTFSPKRSFTAFAYSVRLSLCSATRPGFGAWSAAASSVVSNQCTSESRTSGDRLPEPRSGIWLPRSLRIAASNTSGSCTMSAGFILSNAMPAVRSSRLWQSAQYLPRCGQSSPGRGCGFGSHAVPPELRPELRGLRLRLAMEEVHRRADRDRGDDGDRQREGLAARHDRI